LGCHRVQEVNIAYQAMKINPNQEDHIIKDNMNPLDFRIRGNHST
jgi:hypothetical protein